LSGRDTAWKNAEILLRHQLVVLQRQLGERARPKVWCPKTCATWAKVLQSAVERSACAGPVLARPEVG
jgi:hypothetical protein